MKTKFIHSRYVPEDLKNNLKVYLKQKNGAFKEVLPYKYSKKMIIGKDSYFDFEALPIELQVKYEDMVIVLGEELGVKKDQNNDEYVYDKDNVKVKINDNTLIFPVVGNILPSDNVHAFTVIIKPERNLLFPIVISITNHWSELFTGQTRYGKNVFCLVSDLPRSVIEENIDKIIYLKDAKDFLMNKDKNKQL